MAQADTPPIKPHITRLAADQAQAYRTLMLPAYAQHPEAFTSTEAERAALPLAWWQQRLADEVVLAAQRGTALVGAVGLTVEPRERTRHKALLVGMYVQPGERGQGLGRALVLAALAAARQRPGLRLVQLTVTQGNDAALALYERCGFRRFGLEPMAVALGERFLDKLHLWRPLAEADTGADTPPPAA
jgi:RimJ/RimL family protein N-acetyltransferase